MPAPDFSHLKAYQVTEDTTAEFIFVELDGDPSVICAPGTEDNKPFYNESMRLSVEASNAAKRNSKPQRGKSIATMAMEMTPEKLEETRDRDRVLIANYCARSWGTAPTDSTGAEVPFTPDNCLAFFRALPNYIFDPIRPWVTNPHNFARQQDGPLGVNEGAELGKP